MKTKSEKLKLELRFLNVTPSDDTPGRHKDGTPLKNSKCIKTVVFKNVRSLERCKEIILTHRPDNIEKAKIVYPSGKMKFGYTMTEPLRETRIPGAGRSNYSTVKIH
jgi:hypothetical protein